MITISLHFCFYIEKIKVIDTNKFDSFLPHVITGVGGGSGGGGGGSVFCFDWQLNGQGIQCIVKCAN